MADQTLDQLPEQATPQDADLLYAVRAGVDSKIKRSTLVSGLVPAARTVATGPGLSGGGDLSANRTLTLDVPGLTETLAPVAAADYTIVHEASSGQPRRVRLDRLPSASAAPPNTFLNVAVSGQPTIIADGNTDTLNLAAGANVTLTASSVTDTVTIAAPGLVPESRSVSAGPGLSGGGTLAANRSLAVDIAGQAEATAPTLADHYILTHDTAAGTFRKLRASLLSGGTYVLPPATGSTLGGVRVGSGLAVDSNGTVTLSYTMPPASTVSLGGIKVGANLAAAGDGTLSANPPYVLPAATAGILGGIKVGANLSVTADGTLSATASGGTSYVLPVATTTTLGGVRQGSNVTISGTGVISVAAPYSLPAATTTALGGVRVGTGLAVDGTGLLSVTSGGGTYTLPPATATVLGGVKIGSGVIAAADGTISVPSSGGTNDGTIRPTGVTKGTGLATSVRTANTAAIQAAINAMATQGSGRVALGGGTIEINGELVLTGGHGSIRILDGEAATIIQVTSGVNIIRLSGARHTTVENMELEYASIQTTGAGFDYAITDPHAGLRLRDSMFCKFSNLVFRNCWISVCVDTDDADGSGGGGSYSNQYDHVEINVAANTGWGFAQRRGTGSTISNMYITANGTNAPCNGGVLMLAVGQTTFSQCNVEWLKCKRAIRLSNCYGTVFNSVNIEGITPLATNNGAAAVVHMDSLCTATFTGGTITNTLFDQTTNAVSIGLLFSIHSQSKLEVVGMFLAYVRKVGTVRTILLGCDNSLTTTMDGAFASFRNITLRRADNFEHYNLDDLAVHRPAATDATSDGPLREFNNLLGSPGVLNTWQMATGVPSSDPTAPTPPPANVLYLLRHGSWNRFVGNTTSNLTLTLSDRVDGPMRNAAQSIPRLPMGARCRVQRGASASGTGVMTVNNWNGTAITTLAVATTAEFFFDGTTWFLMGKISAA